MSIILPLLSFLGRKNQTNNMGEAMKDATHKSNDTQRSADGSRPRPKMRKTRSMDGTLKAHNLTRRPMEDGTARSHPRSDSSKKSQRSRRHHEKYINKPSKMPLIEWAPGAPVVAVRPLGKGEVKSKTSRAA